MKTTRNAAAALIVGLLFLAYYPARFVWDISTEMNRGLMSVVAFIVLVAAAVALAVVYVIGSRE